MREVSLESMRAMFAQETGEIPLAFLILEHDDFEDGPIKVVYNNQPIVRADGVYYPAPFDIPLPEETSDRVPTLPLTMMNLDANIIEQIKTIQGRIKVTLEIALASAPDTLIAGPFEMWTMTASYDEQMIQANLGHEDDILNTAFPGNLYLPSNSPGMF